MNGGKTVKGSAFSELLETARNLVLTFARCWGTVVSPRLTSLISFDPERLRYYYFYYAAATATALVVLFRGFILSDRMLYSNDVIGFGIFYRTVLKDYLLAKGGIAPWNPYICCGLPFVDAIHSGILYPLTIIDFCGNMFRMIGYNFIFHFFLSGTFMYLAARQLKLAKLAATFAGVSYMFAPCLISWVAPGHDGKIYAATFFPLVILFLDRVLTNKRLVDASLLGLVFGIIILTPHLQMAYYVLWVVIIYTLYKLIAAFRRSKAVRSLLSPIGLVTYAVALGLSISAIQLLPSFKYITEYSPRSRQAKGYTFASQFSLHEEEAFSQIVPEFCGADKKNGPRYYWGKNRFKDNSESVGMVTLFLALVGFLLKGRREKYFWAALALAVFLYALGPMTPFLRLVLAVVPYADAMAAPSTSMFIFVFCVAVLSGFGVQNVLDRLPSSRRRRDKALRVTLWLVPAVLLVVAEHFSLFGEEMLLGYCKVFHPTIVPSENATLAKWNFALRNLPNLQTGLWLAALHLGITSIVIRSYLSRRRVKLLLWLLPLGVVIADCHFNRWFLVLYDQNRLFGKRPVVEYLSGVDGHGRTVTFPLDQYSFQLGYNGIPSTVGPHGKELLWYHSFIGEWSRYHYFIPRVANLAGTRYIICPLDHVLPPDTLGPIPLDTAGVFGEYVVFENRNAFPRVYLVSKYQVVPNRKDIYPLVLKGDEDLRQMVYLEEHPDLEIDSLANDSSYAKIDYYGIDSISIRVNCLTNKLLILTDNYYPAWHAYVDGVKQKIYRAYGSFRAVEVPAGSKQVIFRYHSTVYQRGKLLTFIGLIIAFTVLGLHFLRRIRPATGKGFGQLTSPDYS